MFTFDAQLQLVSSSHAALGQGVNRLLCSLPSLKHLCAAGCQLVGQIADIIVLAYIIRYVWQQGAVQRET